MIAPDTQKADDQVGLRQAPTAQNKSGVSCFLIGCLGLAALIVVPLVAIWIYFASLSDAELGAKIVGFLKNSEVQHGVKQGIREAEGLTQEQKKTIIMLYDKILTDHDKLPPQKQQVINKNVYVMTKKLFTEPKKYQDAPPPELFEILMVLDMQTELNELMQTPPQDQTQPSLPSSPLDFDFSLPQTQDQPQNKSVPTSAPSHQTGHDF